MRILQIICRFKGWLANIDLFIVIRGNTKFVLFYCEQAMRVALDGRRGGIINYKHKIHHLEGNAITLAAVFHKPAKIEGNYGILPSVILYTVICEIGRSF